MSYAYTAIRVSPPGPSVEPIGEAFDCEVTCHKYNDKYDVVDVVSTGQVAPIVVASIPILRDPENPTTSGNWVKKLLGNSGIPVFPTSLTFPAEVQDARNFQSASFALVLDQFVIHFVTRDYSEGNFILGIRNEETHAGVFRPLRDAVIFESESMAAPVVGYTQSNLLVVYRDANNDPLQFMMAFDKPIPFSELALMFLKDKTLNVLDYFDADRTVRGSDTLEIWRHKTADGKTIATWFSSRDGKLKFIASRNHITDAVLAAQEGIRNSGRDDIDACLKDFTNEYLTINENSNNVDRDLMQLCMRYLHV